MYNVDMRNSFPSENGCQSLSEKQCGSGNNILCIPLKYNCPITSLYIGQ